MPIQIFTPIIKTLLRNEENEIDDNCWYAAGDYKIVPGDS